MNLGTKLIISLVAVIVLTMAVHGYLSIDQDRENIERELTVGMRGFSRVLQAGLAPHNYRRARFQGNAAIYRRRRA